jgi:hypothetical protein
MKWWTVASIVFVGYAALGLNILDQHPFLADLMNLLATGVMWRIVWKED